MRLLAVTLSVLIALVLCACPASNSFSATPLAGNTAPVNESVKPDDEGGNGDEGTEDPPDDSAKKPEVHPPQTLEQQRKSEYVAFEGGLRAYPDQGKVELDAYLLGGQTRPLEYFLVLPGGNTHESLFSTGARGLHLKRALEMIGLSEGKVKFSGRGYLDKPVGDRVRISVRFDHAETGEETVVNVEKWLWDHNADAHPEEVGFVFTGGFEKFRPELNRTVFEADRKGNLIALWRDASCVLDNDRETAYMPDIYAPYPDADGMPKSVRGMMPPVTLIFERFKE